jgi:hypothetical protein
MIVKEGPMSLLKIVTRDFSVEVLSLLNKTEDRLYLTKLNQSLMGPADCNLENDSPYPVGNRGS